MGIEGPQGNKHQSGAELLVRRLLFQRVVKEIAQEVRADLPIPNYSHNGPAAGRGSLFGGPFRTGKPVHHTWKGVTIMPKDIQLVRQIQGDI